METCGFENPPESTNTSFENPWPHTQNLTALAVYPIEPNLLGRDNSPALGPAGTVHCSLYSWVRFVQFHLAAETENLHPLLSNASFQKLHTRGKLFGQNPPLLNYTCDGWVPTTRCWAKGDILVRNGSNGFNYAAAWLDLDSQRTFLATTNIGAPSGQQGTNCAVTVMIPERNLCKNYTKNEDNCFDNPVVL
jgi:D-alanyl-D-alanine carboxypeptidase